MNESRDSTLVDAAAAGDQDALERLLERHAPELRRRIAGLMPRRWRSLLSDDDILQQTYADAFLSISRLQTRDEDVFLSWLARMARRNLIDAVRMLDAEKRGGGRRRVEPGGESGLALYEVLGGTSQTPSRQAARIEAGQALDQALRRLPAEYQRVVRMFDLEGRSIEEAAEAMGRTTGATYMLRIRAHRMLCEIMGTESKYLSKLG